MDSDNLIKQPFRSYTLDEDKKEEKSEVISLKINQEERALIEALKIDLCTGQDAKVFKCALKVLEKVILNDFGRDLFRYLTSVDRRRPVFSVGQDGGEPGKK